MQHQAFPFPHNRLEVFQISLEMATQAKRVANRVPRGHRTLADQLLRSSGSTVLLIGEGANRYTTGAKRQRYSEARGECGEVAATAELLSVLELVPRKECEALLTMAGRVAAMLTRLIKRFA
jgi:four helix bundle protein